MHQLMAATLDTVIAGIKTIQNNARRNEDMASISNWIWKRNDA